jgi:hypothetical protein
MEDFGWFVPLIITVAIVALRMWAKAFQSPSGENQSQPNIPPSRSTPRPPATSYQDILKEMQASSERAQKAQVPEPRPVYENARSAEKVNIPAKSLERTPTVAKSLETLPSYERQTRKRPSAIEMAGTTKTSVNPTNQAVNYGRLLRNPQNVRTAFVLSEVFNRKFDF